MAGYKKILLELVGAEGVETLNKSVFNRRSNTVTDSLDLYLPLLVVPRALLSWLVQNLKPMKINEAKELSVPGLQDMVFWVRKIDMDQYQGELRLGGDVVHKFDNQPLPAIGGHLMSIGQLYEIQQPQENTLIPNDAKDQLSESVRIVMRQGGVGPEQPQDPEHVKWFMSQSSIMEMTKLVGKLVDTLVAKHKFEKDVDSELEAIGKDEMDTEPKDSKSPEEVKSKDDKAAEKAMDGDSHFTAASQSAEDKLNIRLMSPTPLEPTKSKEKPAPAPIKVRTFKESFPMKKADMPSGAAKPKAPTPPQQAKQAQGPSKSPAASAAAQAQASASGRQAKPNMAGANKKIASNNPAASVGSKMPTPKMNLPKLNLKSEQNVSGLSSPTASVEGSMAMSENKGYFRSKLGKAEQAKPISLIATESELLASKDEAGRHRFTKNEDGTIKYKPTLDFLVAEKTEKGRGWFFNLEKREDGNYNLSFNTRSDPDMVKAFCLMLKSELLARKQTLKNGG